MDDNDINLLFWNCFVKICKKGHDGSYRYYIDEYERELLMEKIRGLENELIITDQDEQILETKQVVINELIEIRQKKKFKNKKKN